MKIELFGQPVMTASEKIVGNEILFRMGCQKGDNAITPKAYMGAMWDDTMPWFMDATVIGMLIACNTQKVKGTLFLNVCSETLSAPNLFTAWLKGVRELVVRRGPGRVAVEIPEQGVSDLDALRDRLHDIRDAGAMLALDDYPGGDLTYKHLTLYHWDFVKVCTEQCREQGLCVVNEIRSIREVRPAATIIVERLPRDLIKQARQAGANGFQSFDIGLPEPLNMLPFHNEHKLIPSPVSQVGSSYQEMGK